MTLNIEKDRQIKNDWICRILHKRIYIYVDMYLVLQMHEAGRYILILGEFELILFHSNTAF